ncbi:hypothetical protein OG735_19690 [Streptomyces sp. NBC_01210]|uniref:hypothetical protein n=1 Tax=Streptomyces sp. NBC_01210 TaxID=2903774 RepID=UPI002E0D590C|nr:hypothetical protein OG735_19690 [Streptomyces sp. NBC_01210]
MQIQEDHEKPRGEHDVPEAPAPHRWGRTALIVAGAAVLGVLAGTVTGYAVQYDRRPTPLSPLSQPELRTPKTVPAGPDTTPLTISANRRHKTDGDLRKLLVKKPKGAQASKAMSEGWTSVMSFADGYNEPDESFTDLVESEIRRIATTTWEQRGEVFVTVNLLQFRDETRTAAAEWARGQQAYMPRQEFAGNAGELIAGSGNGRVYVYNEPHREAGYEPLYQARAIAYRGDVAMEIWYINNTRKVSEKAVTALAEQQLGRL